MDRGEREREQNSPFLKRFFKELLFANYLVRQVNTYLITQETKRSMYITYKNSFKYAPTDIYEAYVGAAIKNEQSYLTTPLL